MGNKDLPSKPFQWKSEVKDRRLKNQTICLSKPLVLWAKGKEEDAFIEPKTGFLLGLEHYNDATTKLSDAKQWNLYLDSFVKHAGSTLGGGKFPEIGTFSLVRQLQVECSQLRVTTATNYSPKFTPIAKRTKLANRKRQPPETPTPLDSAPGGSKARLEYQATPEDKSDKDESDEAESEEQEFAQWAATSTPDHSESSSPDSLSKPFIYPSPAYEAEQAAVEDEQTVNSALVMFLKAVTMHFHVQAHWSLHRQRFVFGERSAKIFEARVDGYLRSGADNQVKAIIEVKPFSRKADSQGIRMQEGAQMAAWICSYPDHNPKPKQTFRRLLISQDRHEVYLTVARYNTEYINYITNKEDSGKDFLRMTEYGPYSTMERSAVKRLGHILLAFALQECSSPPSASSSY
ncbi:hypothetical protein MMC30_007143 [Trapelia coarctata]|nr:hypothetical protein [Trapelia coarctata]